MGLLDGYSLGGLLAPNPAYAPMLPENRMLSAADYSGVQPGYAQPGPTNAGPVYDAATALWNGMKAAPGAYLQQHQDFMNGLDPNTGQPAVSGHDRLNTLAHYFTANMGPQSVGGLLGGPLDSALGAGPLRNVPGMDRLAALASDNAAANRLEFAAGSPSRPFASMSGQTVLPNPINGWHASPYSFDRFDLSKIGTGEGNQAYGQGIYSAESPAVSGPGGQYDRQFTAKNLGQYDLTQQQDSILRALRAGKSDMDILREQASMGADFDQAHAALDQMKAAKAHIYQLAIHADPASLLDWHKPLSMQSPQVQDTLRQLGAHIDLPKGLRMEQMGDDDFRIADDLGITAMGHGGISARGSSPEKVMALVQPSGARFYQKFDDPAAASQRLNEAGIPGISYLDGLSRTIGTGTLGKGTRNTVMFDAARIEILRKFGLLGAALGGGLLGGEQQ